MATSDEDRSVADQIEKMLYAPNADATPTCKETLDKAISLSKSLSTPGFVSGVRSYIDDFKSRCKQDLLPAEEPKSNKTIYIILFVIIIVVALGAFKLKK